MLYQLELTIPSQTLQSNPLEGHLILPKGVINQVEVAFPPGCAALAYVEIYVKEHKIWPSDPDSAFHWDNYTLRWNEDFAMEEIPFELVVRGWNRDELYEHTVTVRVAMLSKTSNFEQYLTRLIGTQNIS